MKKLCLIFTILFSMCILCNCGKKELSASEIQDLIDKTMTEQNNEEVEENETLDSNLVEFSGADIYKSSNVKIQLKSVELGHTGFFYDNSDPYDGVTFKLFVENLSSEDISYFADTIIINGFEIPTAVSGDFLFNLSGNNKTIESITVEKEDLDEAGISSIESIELEDNYLDIYYSSGRDMEELENAKVILSTPYELKWR